MTRNRVSTPGTGMPALVGLLIVVFCIAGLLVYEAWSTGRSRRDIAERGLQDYAAYATWSTARMADATLAASLGTLFRGLIGSRVSGTGELPPLAILQSGVTHVAECDCALRLPADYYFRVDLRSGELLPLATPVSPAPTPTGYASAKVGSYTPQTTIALPTREQAQQVSRAVATARIPATADFAVLFVRIGDSARVLGIAPVRSTTGAIVGAFGFVTSAELYARTLIAHLWRLPKILPLAITRGLPSDSLLTATVSTPDGNVIYRSPGWSPGLLSDTASLAPPGGGMRVTVALRQDAVARLGAGLIPPSRVPVWVGLLLLTGLLTAIILRNLQREHELSHLRADFTASVSHELRTPLAQIMLFGETLTLGRARSEIERARAAEVIVREARRLMQLVENTLQFARAGRPVVGLSPERVPLAPVVADVIAGFEPLAASRGVNIVTELDQDCVALVDRSALRQMLINLVDNALKYGPRGQTVTVGFSSHEPGVVTNNGVWSPERPSVSRAVRLWVDDEGPGITSGGHDDIWAPFVRGKDEGLATGCGLGLAVVRELAARHNGRAWVENAPGGRGSRFVLELPAFDESAGSALSDDSTAPEKTRDESSAVA